MLTRYLSSPKKILILSLLYGLLAALLVAGIHAFYQHAKREQRYQVLINDLSVYLESYFRELKVTADNIQPLTASTCRDVSAELTSRSAFHVNVRAFLLVKDEIAYCSSATGDMSLPLNEFVPDIDQNKDIDISFLQGTPMLPGKPAIAVWFRNPLLAGRGVFTTLNVNLTPYLLYTSRQRDIAGVALIVNGKALTTFSPNVIPASELPDTRIGERPLPGYPVSFALYGDLWPTDDIQISVLLGLFVGVLTTLISGYMLNLRLQPGREILSGIKRNQFYVVWQPVVESGKLRVTGAEALLRWKHPQAGAIPPDAFIGYAEAQDLIVPLTRHLFKLIAADATTLQTVLPPGAKLGVNIAPGHMHAPSFKDDVLRFLASLPHGYFQLVFEITERDMLKETEAASLFDWIHQQGIEIAIDDFGTGHSALIYLEKFTLDFLKIDRGFINAIGTETVTSPVLDAVLTLANKLNMTTVAEGVETPEQAKWLRARGVNYLQGYLFSYPLTVRELVIWQRNRVLPEE